MDWNRLVIVAAQCVAAIVLGVCVAMGHNSAITDALLAVCGSIAGIGIFQTIKAKDTNKPT